MRPVVERNIFIAGLSELDSAKELEDFPLTLYWCIFTTFRFPDFCSHIYQDYVYIFKQYDILLQGAALHNVFIMSVCTRSAKNAMCA
jgi:hypothetical protein